MRARSCCDVVFIVGLLAVSHPVGVAESLAPRADDPDLLLWLDATDRATLSTDEQGFVSGWASKARRVSCRVTAEDQQRPQAVADAWNGKPALRFDGQDDVLRNVQFQRSARTWTLLIVALPRSNKGYGIPDCFHGFFSANEHGKPDFVTGLNVDMGGGQTERFVWLNVESNKGGGATNLLFVGTDFGKPRVLAVCTGPDQTTLYAESTEQASRSSNAAETSLEEIRVGARCYLEGRETGFVDADIAEIVLYARALSSEQIQAMSQYLQEKYAVASATTDEPRMTRDEAIRLATSLAAAGHAADAERIYTHLDQVPGAFIRAAVLRGRVMLEPRQATVRLLAALRDDDMRVRGQAARLLAHECPANVVAAVVTEFAELPPASQTILLGMRWSRATELGRELALQALESRLPIIRSDGLHLLTEVGHAADVTLLSRAAVEDQDPQVQASAELALRHLAAAGTDEAIVDVLSSMSGRARDALIRAARDRRTRHAETMLLQLAASPDAATRVEALMALQQLGSTASVPTLIDRLLVAATAEEQGAAERAVWLCSLRGAGSPELAAPVIDAYQRANATERTLLLPVLGRIGGPRAAELITVALADAQPALRAAAVRGLANWPDATMADQLIQLARHTDVPMHRVWAVRGYIRVVSLPSTRAAEQTVQMLRVAWQLAERDEERMLILQRLPAAVCVQSLEMAMGQLHEPKLQTDAVQAAAQLAEALLPSDPQTARRAIEKILQANVDPDLRTRLSRHLSSEG